VTGKVLAGHPGEFTGKAEEVLVVSGGKDMLLRTGIFRRAMKWSKVLADAGTRELVHRMGHVSMQTVLICRHAISERDRGSAESLDKRITKGRKSGKPAEQPAGKSAKAAGGTQAKRGKPTVTGSLRRQSGQARPLPRHRRPTVRKIIRVGE
jgi:hypothetical protein